MTAPTSLRSGLRVIVTAAFVATWASATVACDSTVTESDLQKWTNNDLGLARITEVVADPKQPIDTRIRALEVVVEKGFPLRVRGMLHNIRDEAELRKIADRLATQLLKHIENKSQYQLDAKDTLMTLQAYVSPELWAKVQATVAAWAFSDISWDSPAAEVQEKIQTRISSGQIMDLGKHGWQAAAILIKNGYVVDKMVRYLGAAKDPAATALLLKALRALHANTGVQAYHLDALRSTGSPEALAYLLEMYMNPELDDEFRAGAFNVAVEMMELPEVKKNPAPVVAQLLKLIQTDNPEDRWLGAANLLHLDGATNLDAILGAFKDDKVYKKAAEDPAKSVMDFCLDIYDLGYTKEALPKFVALLDSGNRIQKAISIVCLKANGGVEAKAKLQQIAKTPAKEAVSIDDFLGADLTLSRLAENALQGLAMITQIEKDKLAGKYDDEQAKTRRLLTIFELELVGDEYDKAIEERYQAWLAEEQEAKKGATKAEAEEGQGAAPTGEGAAKAGDQGAPD